MACSDWRTIRSRVPCKRSSLESLIPLLWYHHISMSYTPVVTPQVYTRKNTRGSRDFQFCWQKGRNRQSARQTELRLLARGESGDRDQHVFLAHDQVRCVQRGQLEAVAVGNGVSGTGFNAVAAEDAAVVVDVVDLGVAL